MTGPPDSAASILLADDDVEFGGVLRAFLNANSYRCDFVPDAAQALQALGRATYDLLISDIGMPGNDRLELVQRVAALPHAPPVILLTGSPTVETATRAFELPVRAYLTKPPKPEELLRVVRQTVDDGRVTRTVSVSHRRLHDWTQEVSRIQELLQRAPAANSGAYFESYLNITIMNLVGSLGDFAEVANLVANSHTRKPHLEASALTKALEETIEVLEKTRRNFHSKELGALRRKLEQVLREPSAESGKRPISDLAMKS
jgi:DNA-binding response OmpR family regulator